MRLPRFRLRSMMLGVIILALALMVAVQATRLRREEARAAEAHAAARMSLLRSHAALAASGTTPFPGAVTGQANPAPSKSESQPRHKVRSPASTGRSTPASLLHRLVPGGWDAAHGGEDDLRISEEDIGDRIRIRRERGDKDIYAFTRRFPLGTPEMTTTRREVEFSGDRIKVFEDESQCIVIEGVR